MQGEKLAVETEPVEAQRFRVSRMPGVYIVRGWVPQPDGSKAEKC